MFDDMLDFPKRVLLYWELNLGPRYCDGDDYNTKKSI